MRRNPFTTLYVTERLDQAKFPALFSPMLVPYMAPLFEDGNVVVEGTQGTGKSMLLALLQTEVRLAYAEETNHPYPVQDLEMCQFVCAGINLATNQALRSVSRWTRNDSEARVELRLCFVDFVNAWILRDLFISIDQLTASPNRLWEPLRLGGSRQALESATIDLANEPFIHKLMVGDVTAKATIHALSNRIEGYLKYFNGRPKELPPEILDTQTQSLGQPLADAVAILKQHGCLASSTRVLISIDQFEQLLELEASLPDRPYGLLRDTIEQAMHRREPALSFRIGTRPYAWQQITGEALRDYHRLDMDEMLRKTEHGNRHLFSDLASDVFDRRLRSYGYEDIADSSEDTLAAVFGQYPKPATRVKHIGPNANWSRVISVPNEIGEEQCLRIREIAVEDPLEAKLAVAWELQQYANGGTASLEQTIGQLPWNKPEKRWWKKERLWLAILQLAADNRQKIVMFGKKDIIDLSGSNILVFGSICQHIWECWIRDLARKKADAQLTLPIDYKLQNEGILKASDTWHQKISEERWIGDTLFAFLDEMGTWLRGRQIDDKAMSYPGGNGISLANRELVAYPDVKRLLSEATGRGFLLQRKHTPKNRARGESTKWYLHPILAPYYELTINLTKEPLYISGGDVQKWLERAGVPALSANLGKQRLLPLGDDME